MSGHAQLLPLPAQPAQNDPSDDNFSMHAAKALDVRAPARSIYGRLIPFPHPIHFPPSLQAAEALDPREGRWQALPPAPLARSSFGIAALHDCVYAVGGNIGTEVLNDVSLGELRAQQPSWCRHRQGWRSRMSLCSWLHACCL